VTARDAAIGCRDATSERDRELADRERHGDRDGESRDREERRVRQADDRPAQRGVPGEERVGDAVAGPRPMPTISSSRPSAASWIVCEMAAPTTTEALHAATAMTRAR
jgi:hypothetical protein